MKDEFIKFLKSKRLWNKFNAEFEKSNWQEKTLEEYFDSVEPIEYVDYGFYHTDTKDGLLYWEKIDGKWLEYLKTINK